MLVRSLVPAVLGFFCVAVAVCSRSVEAAEIARPNIVVIMPDDQGYGDHGVTGNTVIRTPNIDALAQESASMSDFYVCPVCSPTRASLMTGRYHYRTRVVDTFKGRSMMEPEEVTVAEVLQDAGYATGIFGKWHLGDNYPLRPDDQGFDESYIHRGGGLAQPSEPIENNRRYTNPILFENGKQIETEGYCTDLYFDAAIRFIDRCKQEGKPFFVYLPTNAPHGPYHDVPQELYEYYKTVDLKSIMVGKKGNVDQLARIAAMIENVDQNIGRLDQHLKEQGLFDNTMVVYLVDNGPNSMRFAGPFRGMKATVHEGGIRSPFFVRWPGRLLPGTVSDRIAAHIDLLPTLADAAGVSVPARANVDGRSLLPLLEGKNPDWPDRHLVLQVHRGDEPDRYHHMAVRNQRWKLVHPSGFGKEEMPEGVPFELYDMASDQGEKVNLAGSKPEKLEAMLKAYDAWFDDVSTTRTDNYAPPRMVIGSDNELVSALTLQDWRVSDSEGWGVSGVWLVNVERPAKFDAELVYSQPVGPMELSLSIGSVTRKATLKEGQTRLVISGISVPQGDAEVQVRSSVNGRKGDPYHVILSRVD
ncbi:arylsulfatase [Rubripirellula sp.]|nr:arylsulfatase [Rubripirellula sp.]MDB4624506.1 arylsulfatase [Rubripirellula sp.]